VSGLTWLGRLDRPSLLGRGAGDTLWILALAVGGALVLAWLLTFSLQVASAFVLVLLVVGLHHHDRRWGIAAMLAFWFLAPGLRRVLGLFTGYVENDPLSVAPFAAVAAIAARELVQVRLPNRIRSIILLAAGGFLIGLPTGMLYGPRAATYACGAYLAGLSAALLGFNERGGLLRDSTVRRVLLFGLPAIAAYAILQRALPLPAWDQAWLDASDFNSIGASRTDEVRVFATLNSPGALAPLLALSLLCYLTVRPKHVSLAVIGATLVAVALALTLVRSSWISLIVAALAHVIASRGASARLVLGAGAVIVAVTLALSPVSATARDVVNRFDSIGSLSVDESANDRQATFSETLPQALRQPLGHGLGSAGQPSKLAGSSELPTPDNGYLSLIYQVGPVGFLLVLTAIGFMLRAAWSGARSRAPGQDLRLLLFAMLVFTIVQLGSGDQFYGSNAVIFWFIGGQVLAYEYARRRRPG
jgi:O-antigen ligase